MARLAWTDVQTFDDQAGMSKKAAQSDVICSYWQRLRERISAEQPTFNHGGAREAGMEV